MIKIIPISVRNTNNREIQTQGAEITITTNIPETQPLQSYLKTANNGCYIPFKLSSDANVSLDIFRQKVKTIETGQKPKGSYTQKDRAIFWDLKNDSRQNIPSELYFYKINAGNFSAIKSMIAK